MGALLKLLCVAGRTEELATCLTQIHASPLLHRGGDGGGGDGGGFKPGPVAKGLHELVSSFQTNPAPAPHSSGAAGASKILPGEGEDARVASLFRVVELLRELEVQPLRRTWTELLRVASNSGAMSTHSPRLGST